MTVQELINELSALNPDLELKAVFTNESGQEEKLEVSFVDSEGILHLF